MGCQAWYAARAQASSDREHQSDNANLTGNYKSYYSKRRFKQDPYAGDERLAIIPKEWMQDKRVLDIGCNTGKVTVEIGTYLYRLTASFLADGLLFSPEYGSLPRYGR